MATRKTTRKRSTPRGRTRSRKRKGGQRRWLRGFMYLLLFGIVLGGGWFAWIDYQVRRDFETLQWALPGRLYARPLELYVGAHLDVDELSRYLQRLGYRQVAQPDGPGEYTVSGQVLRLRSRGFDFWDGHEPAAIAEVGFSGQRVRYLRGAGDSALALLRLEPVEIAQINPITGEDRLPVALEDVPEALVQAVIAVEDQRFYSHFGVDPIGILRAALSNLRAGEIVEGGSTLTQQLVKNLYLDRARTFRRKIEEAMMALALELHFDKDLILNVYLNEVFLAQDGNRAIHGFALAAQHYFGRPLSELTLAELATLAGLPRGPSFYNPRRNPERASQRRNTVLGRMLEQGYISRRQYDSASTARLQLGERGVKQAEYPAFLELVYADLARDYDPEELRSAGLRIFTTLDIGLQDTVEATLDKSVAAVQRPPSQGKGLEAAVVLTDAATGEVRALAGSRKPGYTGFNRALHAKRQIGSLVKPAVYLAALETPGFHLATVLNDAPIELVLENGDIWRPSNYDNALSGDVYLYDALQRSLNLATVDLGMELGVHKVSAMLDRLGSTRMVPAYPSLLLGAVNMAPFEVAQLYQTLASNGFRSPLRAVEAVTTAEGEPLTYYGIETEQVVDPVSVYLLEQTLYGVFEEGTARSMAPRLREHLPLAGKTGSTNDLRDSWFAGYGDDLVGVVWLGHDDNSATGLTGATGALRVWTDIMLQADLLPRQTLPPADLAYDTVPLYPERDPARRDCSRTQRLPFHPARLPEVAWSCEVNESFFDRVIDRFRERAQ